MEDHGGFSPFTLSISVLSEFYFTMNMSFFAVGKNNVYVFFLNLKIYEQKLRAEAN